MTITCVCAIQYWWESILRGHNKQDHASTRPIPMQLYLRELTLQTRSILSQALVKKSWNMSRPWIIRGLKKSFLLIPMHCIMFLGHEWMKPGKKAKTWHIAQCSCWISVWELISISKLSQNSVASMIPWVWYGQLIFWFRSSFLVNYLLIPVLSATCKNYQLAPYLSHFISSTSNSVLIKLGLGASVTWVESPFFCSKATLQFVTVKDSAQAELVIVQDQENVILSTYLQDNSIYTQ
jgi:hypothetical protein